MSKKNSLLQNHYFYKLMQWQCMNSFEFSAFSYFLKRYYGFILRDIYCMFFKLKLYLCSRKRKINKQKKCLNISPLVYVYFFWNRTTPPPPKCLLGSPGYLLFQFFRYSPVPKLTISTQTFWFSNIKISIIED